MFSFSSIEDHHHRLKLFSGEKRLGSIVSSTKLKFPRFTSSSKKNENIDNETHKEDEADKVVNVFSCGNSREDMTESREECKHTRSLDDLLRLYPTIDREKIKILWNSHKSWDACCDILSAMAFDGQRVEDHQPDLELCNGIEGWLAPPEIPSNKQEDMDVDMEVEVDSPVGSWCLCDSKTSNPSVQDSSAAADGSKSRADDPVQGIESDQHQDCSDVDWEVLSGESEDTLFDCGPSSTHGVLNFREIVMRTPH
mmetsp:Transcript_12532/g.18927  ORF Transcript_12532/g.18927 Transcript_12532/m.18927 type:complete len:254 (+) Transcript_12532:278-1039(+)|eukprot:CAMPEP_0185029888 /NCGR_PEP_ID=MMETSP1103-20130426/16503_1 /TAXON_ID=36769 /ORGANISM="Paraphysomonas bandaiensis, Strain Caron Lab Isolate" /LENGTH=253 /DNA_ID=CAMNT_0027564803 /DNA_START=255 /DNA_END=1016 /DNA_ORIENTATION=+